MLLNTETIVAAFAGHGTGHRAAGVAASLHSLAMRGIVPSPMRQCTHASLATTLRVSTRWR
jgi:hypothetical protein